jgi:hypothetical protein
MKKEENFIDVEVLKRNNANSGYTYLSKEKVSLIKRIKNLFTWIKMK